MRYLLLFEKYISLEILFSLPSKVNSLLQHTLAHLTAKWKPVVLMVATRKLHFGPDDDESSFASRATRASATSKSESDHRSTAAAVAESALNATPSTTSSRLPPQPLDKAVSESVCPTNTVVPHGEETMLRVLLICVRCKPSKINSLDN